nr:hypothetical protein Iba_chr12dCG0430 [Ipomoea batatas]
MVAMATIWSGLGCGGGWKQGGGTGHDDYDDLASLSIFFMYFNSPPTRGKDNLVTSAPDGSRSCWNEFPGQAFSSSDTSQWEDCAAKLRREQVKKAYPDIPVGGSKTSIAKCAKGVTSRAKYGGVGPGTSRLTSRKKSQWLSGNGSVDGDLRTDWEDRQPDNMPRDIDDRYVGPRDVNRLEDD